MWASVRLRCRRALLAALWLVAAVLPAHAQQAIGEARVYATERVVIGGSTFGSTSPLQVVGLPSLAGTLTTVDGSGNIGLATTGTATISAILSATGAVNLGDASGDDIAVNGRLTTALLFKTDNAVDIGASGATRPRDGFFGRNVAIGGTLGVTGASTLAALSATTGSFSSTLGVTGAATLSSTLGVTGATTFGNNAGTSTFASRTTGWRVTSAGDADFRNAFFDNLSVRNFIADLEQVIVGSQRVTKSSSTISQAFTCPALGATSTLWVDDIPSAPNIRVFSSGDSVSIRNFSRSDGDSDGNLDLSISDCVGVVTSYADGTAGNDGQQSWTFTRNAGANGGGMTASTVVAVKTLALDYGTTGMGFAEVSAVDGSEGQNAPYYQLATWATAPIAANITVKCRLGKLAGLWDYAAGGSIFGLACGDSAATNVTVDPTNGFRVRFGTTDKFKADTSGNLSLTGDLAMGTSGVIRSGATALDAATGYWLAHNAGTPQFRIGTMSGSTLTKGIRWDGSTLTVKSDYATLDSTGVGVPVAAAGAFATTNGYRFTGSALAGDSAGVYAYEVGSGRVLGLKNDTTGTGDASISVHTARSGGSAYLSLASTSSLGYTATLAGETSVDILGGALGGNGSLLHLTNNLVRLSRSSGGNYSLWIDTQNRYVGINASGAPGQALEVGGGLRVAGAAVLSASMPVGVWSVESTYLREYIGDGTGYSRVWSKRTGSVSTDLLTLTDAGNATLTGSMDAASFKVGGTAGLTASINPSACSNLGITGGLITSKTGC